MKKAKQKDFEKRAKMYLEDVRAAGQKHSIDVRPVITTYGPDLQLVDLLSKSAPEKKQEELVEKV